MRDLQPFHSWQAEKAGSSQIKHVPSEPRRGPRHSCVGRPPPTSGQKQLPLCVCRLQINLREHRRHRAARARPKRLISEVVWKKRRFIKESLWAGESLTERIYGSEPRLCFCSDQSGEPQSDFFFLKWTTNKNSSILSNIWYIFISLVNSCYSAQQHTVKYCKI